MFNTFQAAAVIALVVLPGALYTWAFEREVGSWGVGASDRVLRFFGVSAAFWALFAWPASAVWGHYLQYITQKDSRATDLAGLQAMPPWVWLIPIAYVGLPLLGESLAAASLERRYSSRFWRAASRVLAGRDPAPRAWDHLFGPGPRIAGVVRIRLNENGGREEWVGGLFAARSYVGGLSEAADLLLETAYKVEDDGRFARTDGGAPVELGTSMLIERSAIRYLEITPLPTKRTGKLPVKEAWNAPS